MCLSSFWINVLVFFKRPSLYQVVENHTVYNHDKDQMRSGHVSVERETGVNAMTSALHGASSENFAATLPIEVHFVSYFIA